MSEEEMNKALRDGTENSTQRITRERIYDAIYMVAISVLFGNIILLEIASSSVIPELQIGESLVAVMLFNNLIIGLASVVLWVLALSAVRRE